MRGIALTVPDAGRIQLRGTIVGEETRIRTQDLSEPDAAAELVAYLEAEGITPSVLAATGPQTQAGPAHGKGRPCASA